MLAFCCQELPTQFRIVLTDVSALNKPKTKDYSQKFFLENEKSGSMPPMHERRRRFSRNCLIMGQIICNFAWHQVYTLSRRRRWLTSSIVLLMPFTLTPPGSWYQVNLLRRSVKPDEFSQSCCCSNCSRIPWWSRQVHGSLD